MTDLMTWCLDACCFRVTWGPAGPAGVFHLRQAGKIHQRQVHDFGGKNAKQNGIVTHTWQAMEKSPGWQMKDTAKILQILPLNQWILRNYV